MILPNFYLGFVAIFILPQILLYFKCSYLALPIRIAIGVIFSFTVTWLLFLLVHFFQFSDGLLVYLVYAFFLFTILYIIYNYATNPKYYFNAFIKNQKQHDKKYDVFIFILMAVAISPLFQYVGDIFFVGDSIISWNRWAIEIYKNKWVPSGSGYPVLYPAIWGVLYKIQGTSEIWWTAKLSLFVIPVFMTVLLGSLYNDTNDKTYILVFFLTLPYMLWNHSVYGYMDVPVMLLGIMSLIMLYTAIRLKDNNYLYLALLFAGISSITKQAGIAFLIFNIIYILINYRLNRVCSKTCIQTWCDFEAGR